MTHLAETIRAIEEELARAQIRDSGLWRGYRAALYVALRAPEVLSDPDLSDEHKLRVRSLFTRVKLVAPNLDGVPIEDVATTVEKLIADLDDAERVFEDPLTTPRGGRQRFG